MADNIGPLAGVRVLAVEQFGAGPFATLALADMGAEVIKIEDPATGGDVARYVPPYEIEADSLYFQAFNRGKKSVALDLRSSLGRQAFEGLANVFQADPHFLRSFDDGYSAQHLFVITTLIACISIAADQPLVLVKMQGRHFDAASLCHFAGCEKGLVTHACSPPSTRR